MFFAVALVATVFCMVSCTSEDADEMPTNGSYTFVTRAMTHDAAYIVTVQENQETVVIYSETTDAEGQTPAPGATSWEFKMPWGVYGPTWDVKVWGNEVNDNGTITYKWNEIKWFKLGHGGGGFSN